MAGRRPPGTNTGTLRATAWRLPPIRTDNRTYEVRQVQDAFEVYELVDHETGTTARVAPARGGLLVGMTVGGQELFYLDRQSFVDPAQNVRGGNPILFPIAGPLRDNRVEYQGRAFEMKQHGVARLMPWRVVSTSDEGAATLVMELTATEDTLKAYPWNFTLRFTWRLQGRRLELLQSYRNGSDVPMPIHIGFHPYFTISDKSNLRLDIPATRLQDTVKWEEHAYTGTMDWTQDVIDVVFLDVSAQTAGFTDSGRRVRVGVEYDRLFKYLVFWTLKDKPFICLEPWSGRRFSMNSGEDLLHVPPSGTLDTRIAFTGETY